MNTLEDRPQPLHDLEDQTHYHLRLLEWAKKRGDFAYVHQLQETLKNRGMYTDVSSPSEKPKKYPVES